MTVVFQLPVEWEERFKSAAQKQGISVEEFVIDAAQTAAMRTDVREEARLAAINRLAGFGRGSKFGSEAIRRDRQQDKERDERDFAEHLGRQP